MKYEQFLEFYNAGPEPVYKLLLSIIETNKVLMDKVIACSDEVRRYVYRFMNIKGDNNVCQKSYFMKEGFKRSRIKGGAIIAENLY